jgi:ABC transporter transmembrane region
VADMAMNGAATAAGVLAAFYHSPVLAAILLCCVPLLGIPSALLARFSSHSTLTVQQRYSSAGAVAHEVIKQCHSFMCTTAVHAKVVAYDLTCLYIHCASLLPMQVLAGIKTVASLCAERLEVARYSKLLALAERAGIQGSVAQGLRQSVFNAMFYSIFALAFW